MEAVEKAVPDYVKLKEQLYDVSDYFDFLLTLYLFIQTAKNGPSFRLRRYTPWHEAHGDLVQQLNDLIAAKLSLGTSVKDFLPYWFSLCEKNIFDAFSFCIETLLISDDHLSFWFEHQPGRLIEVGPLNSAASQEKRGYVFFLPPAGLQSRFAKAHRLHWGRNLAEEYPEGLQSKLKNLLFVAKRLDEALSPHGFRYEIEGIDFTRLRAAVLPVSSQPWTTVRKKEEDRSFSVEYPSAHTKQMNAAYLHALQCLENAGVNIVVFPELAVNKETVTCIRDYLARHGKKSSPLKMVFLGTAWIQADAADARDGPSGGAAEMGGQNIGYVLSGQGKLLITSQKRTPYSIYDKEKDCAYSENIASQSNLFEFLDIPGLGRLFYFICKDALDPMLTVMAFQRLHASVHVVSAYSTSEAEFLKVARDLACRYAAFSLYCNACASHDGRSERSLTSCGFLACPEMARGGGKTVSSLVTAKENFDLCETCTGTCYCSDIFELEWTGGSFSPSWHIVRMEGPFSDS